MKAVKNKNGFICSCQALPAFKGRIGGHYSPTREEWDIIFTFQESLERFCQVHSQQDRCEEERAGGGHSKIALRYAGTCPKCDQDRWRVVPHPTCDDLDTPRRRYPQDLTRVIPLPTPELRIPGANDICQENTYLRERRESDYDY